MNCWLFLICIACKLGYMSLRSWSNIRQLLCPSNSSFAYHQDRSMIVFSRRVRIRDSMTACIWNVWIRTTIDFFLCSTGELSVRAISVSASPQFGRLENNLSEGNNLSIFTIKPDIGREITCTGSAYTFHSHGGDTNRWWLIGCIC